MAEHEWEIPEDERGLNSFLDKIESEGAAALVDRNQIWDKAVRLFESGIADKPPKNDRAQFRSNIIAPTARRKGALLVEQRPTVDVQPITNGLIQTAKVLRNVIHAGWEEHGMQGALEDIATLFLQVLASGFLEIGWDQNADYGMGSIAMNAVDPRQVIVDPAILRARDLDNAQYMRVRTVTPLHIGAALFPSVAAQLKPCRSITAIDDEDKPSSNTGVGGRILRAAQSAMGKGRASQDPPFPRIALDTYWFQDPRKDSDGNSLYPGGRCVVRANDDVICLREKFSEKTLHDETANPYYDGLWPYEWLDAVPDLNSAWGRDEITAARWIQNTFDRIGNTTVQTMLDNARPFVLAPKNTLDPDTVNTLTRLRHIVLQYTAGRGEVTRQASPIGTGVYLQLMQMCQGILEYTQGLQDAGGGIPAKGRAEVRSSAMLEGLQSAAQVLVRAQARRLEDFLQRAGQKWLSRIFQFMTCVDEETECLTKRGWKHYDELQSTDELYTLNPSTERGEWSPLVKLNVHDYEGPMHRVSGQQVDAFVTPNHRWWVLDTQAEWRRAEGKPIRQKALRGPWGPGKTRLQPIEMRDIKSHHAILAHIPLQLDGESLRRFKGADGEEWIEERVPDAFVELMGWVVTEGHYDKSRGRIRIAQSEGPNLSKCEAIRACLVANGAKHYECKNGRNGAIVFAFAGALAQKIRLLFPDKRLTYDFISKLSLLQVRLLVQTMVAGDGTNRASVRGGFGAACNFRSTDWELANQFQMLSCLAGFHTRFLTEKTPKGRPYYRVRVRLPKYNRYLIRWARLKTKTTQYSGKVWCPTTKTGTWLARRGGRAYITGNSDRLMSYSGSDGNFKTYQFEYASLVKEILDIAIKRVEANREREAKEEMEEILSGTIPLSALTAPVEGDRKNWALEAIKGAWRELRFKVGPMSSLSTTRTQRVQLLAGLKGQGIPIPDSMIMESVGFDNTEDIIKMGVQEMAMKQALGVPPPQPATGKKKSGNK